ncbi:nucleotidyltransferase domain-containing protein [Rhabdobacter roseus]|uniref:Putative nucleotidyltransferase n=1 Tax=Rhabdobacter roseus TaxID=1655419 RepID=A0A840TMI3_9BACT|nr:nucleotidyltransferase domain-containing protein [Rhabdobacter roseus]MBB5285466.1 putative nucleotidyltransferase [Rhabdobacter roseus]
MMYGLAPADLEAITAVLRLFPEVEEALLFGSRAMGNYGPGSEIDLAIKGAALTFDQYLTLLVKLEELDGLHTIDAVHYETIKNADLRDRIRRVGVRIYSQPEKIKPHL